MDNSDLYKIWYVIMKAIEYGPIKNDIIHLDQIIEEKVAHHHVSYRGKKFYIKINLFYLIKVFHIKNSIDFTS